MEIIRTLDFGTFKYSRKSFHSERLDKKMFFGVLVPSEVQSIEGSLYFIHGGNGDDEQFITENLFSSLSENVLDLLQKKRFRLFFLESV